MAPLDFQRSFFVAPSGPLRRGMASSGRAAGAGRSGPEIKPSKSFSTIVVLDKKGQFVRGGAGETSASSKTAGSKHPVLRGADAAPAARRDPDGHEQFVKRKLKFEQDAAGLRAVDPQGPYEPGRSSPRLRRRLVPRAISRAIPAISRVQSPGRRRAATLASSDAVTRSARRKCRSSPRKCVPYRRHHRRRGYGRPDARRSDRDQPAGGLSRSSASVRATTRH